MNDKPAAQKRVLVCGGERVIEMARKLSRSVIREQVPELVVFAPSPPDVPPALDFVDTVEGDPTETDALKMLDFERIRVAVILSDPGASENPDARALLVALAIERIDRDVHTIVEIHNSDNLKHFHRTAVNETVCASELTEKLIARCTRNHHISHFYGELLKYQEAGSELYRVSVEEGWETFRDAFEELVPERMIPVGVQGTGEPELNPAPNRVLGDEEDLWVIAQEFPGAS